MEAVNYKFVDFEFFFNLNGVTLEMMSARCAHSSVMVFGAEVGLEATILGENGT